LINRAPLKLFFLLLSREYKVEADLGTLLIAYRETAFSAAREKVMFERTMLEKEHKIEIDLEVRVDR
jgi:translation elongation factor EF-G